MRSRIASRAEGRLGALVEREYRLLFTGTVITSLGDAIANIALAFAVLDLGSATDLGIVFAARQGANAVVLLFGGVLSDRLPRNRVLVGASLLQGAAQAATAATVLSGHATIAILVGLAVLYGAGDGLVVPAEVGLIPQTVSAARLQQANALQGLSRSAVRVLGPAVGGIIVVAGSPGVALAIDSVSFFACAALLARIRIAPRADLVPQRFFHELREGWREFTSRTWLWSTVLIFGLGNVFFMFWSVLGPAIAKERLGGAGPWATILTLSGVGSIVGGLLAIRHRPRRPLVACILWPLLFVPQLAALAAGAPTWAIAAASFAAGLGISVHLTLWFTVFQREVPEHAQSRVSSYDALGSFVLTPLGSVLAGPVAAALGNEEALWLAAAAIVALNMTMLLIPAVWAIRRDEPGLAAQPT
jgi:MFS family permease